MHLAGDDEPPEMGWFDGFDTDAEPDSDHEGDRARDFEKGTPRDAVEGT